LNLDFQTKGTFLGVEKLAEQLFSPYHALSNKEKLMTKDTVTVKIRTLTTFIDKESFYFSFEHEIWKELKKEADKKGMSTIELIEQETVGTVDPKFMQEAMVEKFIELKAEKEIIF